MTAIGMQLREDGILIPGPNNLSTQKHVWGSRVRFWQLTSESFVETPEAQTFLSSSSQSKIEIEIITSLPRSV